MEGRNRLWRRIIAIKYGVEPNGWFTMRVVTSHGGFLWKGAMGCLKGFQKNICFKIGDGLKVHFQKDNLSENKILQVVWPEC